MRPYYLVLQHFTQIRQEKIQNLYSKTYKKVWSVLKFLCTFVLRKRNNTEKDKQQEHIYLNFGYEDGVLL